jgi:type II secretory pathway pseudopilin PulG
MVNATRRAEAGWSYLEIMVCFAILAVVLGSLFTAQARDFRWLGDALDETRAERAAAARMEAYLSGRETPETGSRVLPVDPGIDEGLPGARVEEEIREIEPGLYSVEVRVVWRGAGAEERRFVLATLVAAEARR